MRERQTSLRRFSPTRAGVELALVGENAIGRRRVMLADLVFEAILAIRSRIEINSSSGCSIRKARVARKLHPRTRRIGALKAWRLDLQRQGSASGRR